MIFSGNNQHYRLFSTLQVIFVLLFSQMGMAAPQKNHFPHFPIIQTNVTFWEKVFETYSVNTAVVHDRDDLTIIYETVPLLDKNLPGSARLNSSYLKGIKKNYVDILNRLARGDTPLTTTEKRVYSLFPAPTSSHRFWKAAENIRIQTGLKEQFREGVIRSGAYMEEMKKILQSYGLPEDLAYLPHVESSFNVKAYSKVGAAGVWQFTRATGTNYLIINSIVDERRDPITATHAAARYLRHNFERLGTWPLAITAYNYGHAGMSRAVAAEGTYEKIFKNYSEGYFKFASRNFYAEFLAARNVAKKLEKALSQQKQPPRKIIAVRLDGYAAVDDICNHFNLSPSTLKEFNPALLSPVWQGDFHIPRGFTLQLPHGKEMLQLAGKLPGHLFFDTQKQARHYMVKRGDSAGKIAQHHGITLQSLIAANNLGKDAVVFTGQNLRIPGAPKERPVSSKTAALSGKKESIIATPPTFSSQKKIRRIAKAAGPEISPPGTGKELISVVGKKESVSFTTHVLPGESPALYAGWLQVEEKTIEMLNDSSAEGIFKPGRSVVLPLSNVSQQEFAKQRKDFHLHNEEAFYSLFKISGFQRYTVEKGDTLWHLSRQKFNLPLWLLKKYNAELHLDTLLADQHLRIPIIESL